MKSIQPRRRVASVLATVVMTAGFAVGMKSTALAVANPEKLPSLSCTFDDEPRSAFLSVEGLVVINKSKLTAFQFQSADVSTSKPEYRFVKGPTLTVNEPDEPGQRAALLGEAFGACVKAPQGWVPRRARIASKVHSSASAKSATVASVTASQILFAGPIKKGWREVFVVTERQVTRGWITAGGVDKRMLATP